VPRSNRGRAPQIGRSREVGRAGRGGAVAGALLRGGDFAGAGETGATELGLDRGLVQKRERGTCNPLGLGSGLDRGSGGVRDGAGGASSPASGMVRAGTRYGYVILRKRTRRLGRLLPSLESDGEVVQSSNRADRRRSSTWRSRRVPSLATAAQAPPWRLGRWCSMCGCSAERERRSERGGGEKAMPRRRRCSTRRGSAERGGGGVLGCGGGCEGRWDAGEG